MYIPQYQLDVLKTRVTAGRVVVIYGPRRTGKTTLLHAFLASQQDYLFVSGEDVNVQGYLGVQSVEALSQFVGQTKLVVIDEAQAIPKIGHTLKLMVDHFPDVAVIATGSSSFDLAHQVGEPLTGRKSTLHLYPLSQLELSNVETAVQTKARLESRLLFGSYPEVVLLEADRDRRDYLHELVGSYLYRDILQVDGVKKAHKLVQLLQLIAHQIGKEVSLNELSRSLGINKLTVERYLDLLEQVFVLVKVTGFSRNLRKEVTRIVRYYFSDLGIRNALLNNFNRVGLRDDVGALWENYLAIERLKKQHYLNIHTNNYFWRTYDQAEIDWVEDRDGTLSAFEFKWGERAAKPPKSWMATYPAATFEVVNSSNYLNFIQ